MKRMTKIGIYGMAVWLLSACGNGTPDYDATGTFEATEVAVSYTHLTLPTILRV